MGYRVSLTGGSAGQSFFQSAGLGSASFSQLGCPLFLSDGLAGLSPFLGRNQARAKSLGKSERHGVLGVQCPCCGVSNGSAAGGIKQTP